MITTKFPKRNATSTNVIPSERKWNIILNYGVPYLYSWIHHNRTVMWALVGNLDGQIRDSQGSPQTCPTLSALLDMKPAHCGFRYQCDSRHTENNHTQGWRIFWTLLFSKLTFCHIKKKFFLNLSGWYFKGSSMINSWSFFSFVREMNKIFKNQWQCIEHGIS